ncbi:uncharacterized protein LOC120603325 isoform X1 [Pteropus medius]|uniref:uncharacterized protein LOC120603325 isoform X1 n=1 Tax=Pteropus vampyrus TaxID=132908 RepID=UPI00196B38DD|nr:uncharacterized protein LOC120603325 isoform X1 [Pteropus giganteus]
MELASHLFHCHVLSYLESISHQEGPIYYSLRRTERRNLFLPCFPAPRIFQKKTLHSSNHSCLIYHHYTVEMLCIHPVIFPRLVLLERERELELKSENLSVNHNFISDWNISTADICRRFCSENMTSPNGALYFFMKSLKENMLLNRQNQAS